MIDRFNIVNVHEIIEILVPMTYLWNIITDWKLDGKWIVEMIMTWKGWTLLRAFKNIQYECKNNRRLVWSKYHLRTEIMEVEDTTCRYEVYVDNLDLT